MHFMNPVPLMSLVELIRGQATSPESMLIAAELCMRLNKTAVEAADYPGFIANRILMPMINEAIFALMEGVGTADSIDKVMKLGMNHPMGPLTLADFIGLDVCLAILEVLHEGLGDPEVPAVSPAPPHGRGWSPGPEIRPGFLPLLTASLLPTNPTARRLALIGWALAALGGSAAVWWLSSYLETLTALAQTDRDGGAGALPHARDAGAPGRRRRRRSRRARCCSARACRSRARRT